MQTLVRKLSYINIDSNKMRSLAFIIVLFALAGKAFGQISPSFDAEQSEYSDPTKAVHLYPNPAVEFVNVRLDHVNMNNVKVTMHNIIGNEINIETERISEHEIRIRVKDFDAGYYLLALKDDQSKFRGTYKFVKR